MTPRNSIVKYSAMIPVFIVGLLTVHSSLFLSQSFGQGTADDYKRMNRQRLLGTHLVRNHSIKPNWLIEKNAMWYRAENADRSTRYQLVRLDKKENKTLFDTNSLWKKLEANFEKKAARRVKNRLKSLKLQFGDSLNDVYFDVAQFSFHYQVDKKQLKKIARANKPKKSAAGNLTVQPSESGTAAAKLKVHNRTEQDFEMFWIDTNGGWRSYGTVKPGGTYTQNTYLGHRWLVRGRDGLNLAYFSVDDTDDVVEVGKTDRVTLKVQRNNRGSEFFLEGNVGYKKSSKKRKSKAPFVRQGRRSPDKKWTVSLQGSNVFLTNASTKKKVQLSKDGSKDNFYGNRIYWSPNSKYFIVLQEKPAQRHTVSFVESSPRNKLQPQLHSFNYLKPGDKVRVLRPQLFSVEDQKQIPVSNELFANPYQVSRFRWNYDSSEFSFLYNQRGHQVLRVVGIKTDGKVREIVGDKFSTFVHYSSKTYLNFLDDSDEVIWASERDGWNHLYLYDLKTGKKKNQITKGKWVLRGVTQLDKKNRQVWFSASGIIPGQDPYYIHHCRINFDGSGLVVLTEGNGTHRISYSPDEKYLIDRYSRVDMPPVTEVRSVEDGSLVCELEKSDWTQLKKAGWRAPERFSTKGRDGKTDIFGVIYRPSNFDPKKKYPVIEYIYAGPHDSFVPKSFGPYRWEKALAEVGFIVVQIDGMGTNNRGKKFHDVCWKNLGDSGFPDRIKWIKAAAKKYPQMDISKVGIFGGSAGGQSSTRALLAFGDFYKVAVSDCGCHDNRMDKIWWNEQWMGWPIGDHYKEQSNVTQAHKLTGDLFLIVGEVDRNVDPASTMQVVNALIKANKDFDLLVVPGGGHGVGWTPYGKRRTADYFVRKIMKKEPRTN